MPKKRKLQVLDADFDTHVESYVEMVTQDSEIEQVKQNLLNAFRLVRSSYASGYKVLTKSFKLKPLRDPKQIITAVAKGQALFELLGLDLHDVGQMYAAARQLAEDKLYLEAKDAFFFLTTIAATSSECWLSLGITSAQCGEYTEAAKACQVAVELAPEKADPYLASAFVKLEMQEYEAAKNCCDKGLQYARAHAKEPWAKELSDRLQAAKDEIASQFEKSQYDCIGS